MSDMNKPLSILRISLLLSIFTAILTPASAEQPEIFVEYGEMDDILSVAVSHDEQYAVSGNHNGIIKLWEISTGKIVRTLKGHTGYVTSVVFSPDGKYVLSASEDKTIRLWEIYGGKELRIFKGHTEEISSVVFSPDGKYVLSGGYDENPKLWDVSTGKELKTFKGTGEIISIAFSPDGRFVISGNKDKTLKLWEVSTGGEVGTIEGHTGFIVSPDGRLALSGDKDKTLQLWNVFEGRKIKTLKGDLSSITSVAFSPDGRYVILANKDKTLKLWDVPACTEVMTFKGYSENVSSVIISPGGRLILSGSKEGMRLWDIATGKEIVQMRSFSDSEWVVITPEGYFNASPNGAKYLNVRVGNNVYSVDNFYEKFFNPVYVASVLQGKKVETVADIRKGILTPPDVKIISPEPNAILSMDMLTVTVSAKDTGGGIDEIRLYHNGKTIGEDTRAVKIIPKGNEMMKTYTVMLVEGINTFKAIGFSKDRTESNPYELIVKLTAPQKDVSLYVIAIGINKYKNPALNLNYAEPDAKGIVEFFRQKGRGLFKEVKFIEIYNEQATKEKITAKLKELENTNPQDAVLLYFAGHGENISDRWYFIPHELTYPEKEEDVKTKGISSDELAEYIKNIKAQKLLMLVDACKAGAVLIAFRGFEDRKALSQLSRSTGVHIIAASTKDQFAAEVKDLGHGVFTYTLLEGLKGKASGGSDTVTVRKLMGYIEEQLTEITKKFKQETQYPVVDSRGMDFPLVLTK